jgi:hypothetical protein
MYTALIIGIVGLLIWYICTRIESEWDASGHFFAAQHKAKEEMTRSERASHRHQRSSANQFVGFFRSVGVGLTVIGFGGAAVIYGLGEFAAN